MVPIGPDSTQWTHCKGEEGEARLGYVNMPQSRSRGAGGAGFLPRQLVHWSCPDLRAVGVGEGRHAVLELALAASLPPCAGPCVPPLFSRLTSGPPRGGDHVGQITV